VSFDGRLRELILEGVEFTADDLTANGLYTANGDHAPNGSQNAIGSAFRRWHAQLLIEPTGQVVASRAPHRKGGMIRVWRPTEQGRAWAAGSDRLL
jgi:hypothetical protein